MKLCNRPIVLASGSQTRRMMLEHAGLDVIVDPPHLDEAEIKQALIIEGATASEVALALAEAKAFAISKRQPDLLVIGADQMLDCGGTWFDKPADLQHAHAQLRALSGKPHTLTSAVSIIRDGVRLWHHVQDARLTMRRLTEAFIDRYLNAVGGAALTSVGAYQVEGPGAQLFDRIEGDHFTILGLPLLPLLGFLRQQEVVPS